MNRIPIFVWSVLVAGLLSDVPDAPATPYSFTNIADNTTLAPLATRFEFGPPAVSGTTVAFRGDDFSPQYLGDNKFAIYSGNGAAITTIVQDGDVFPFGTLVGPFTDAAVSGGTVAFSGRYRLPDGVNFGFGIFTGRGGPLVTIAKSGDVTPAGTFTNFGAPAIDGDRVAFLGRYPQSNGIFVGDGGHPATIVKAGDRAPSGTFGFTPFEDPTISGGLVAFRAFYARTSAIFLSDGALSTEIAKTGDPAPVATFTSFGEPSISGSMAAFSAHFDGFNKSGVFLADNISITTIAKIGDPAPVGTLRGFGSTSVSDGVVAFTAAYDQGIGVFAGNGGPLTTVIKSGDSLFGSTVTGVSFGRFGLDPGRSGNLAFGYWLSDGRYGIALSVPVPEPTTIAHGFLAAIAFTLMMCGRTNRSRRDKVGEKRCQEGSGQEKENGKRKGDILAL